MAGLAIGAVNLIHVIRAPSSSPSAEDKQQPAAPNLADLLRLLLDLTLLGLISQGICSLVLIRRCESSMPSPCSSPPYVNPCYDSECT